MPLLRLLPFIIALSPLPTLASGLAIVMNSGGASLSLIDMSTQRELRRESVLREPHHWALTPDGHTLVVGDSAGNSLLLLDPETGALRRRFVVADPYQLGFSPDGRLLVVNGLVRNQIDVYGMPDYRLVKRFPIRSMPSHLAFCPDSARVFVTLQGSNRVVALDLRSMTILWDKPVGNTPAGILWNHDRLLVADMGTDYLAELDPADGRTLRHIATGRGAHNLFHSPNGQQIWVNNRVAGTITVLDSTSLKNIRTYHLPGGPDDLAFAPDGQVWITRRFAESIAILDSATGDYHLIATGRSPHGIFLNPSAPTPDKVASN
jgi:DNA-binding beta-propeller fold protein YncE